MKSNSTRMGIQFTLIGIRTIRWIRLWQRNDMNKLLFALWEGSEGLLADINQAGQVSVVSTMSSSMEVKFCFE